MGRNNHLPQQWEPRGNLPGASAQGAKDRYDLRLSAHMLPNRAESGVLSLATEADSSASEIFKEQNHMTGAWSFSH